MNTRPLLLIVALFPAVPARAAEDVTPLPQGVRAVWNADSAWREKTATRERLCLNGLWRWQPASGDSVPTTRWGHFKVPGAWPGITDYMQKDCQTVYSHPDWKDQRLSSITAAWYEREVEIPAGWAGRQIVLDLEYLNSFATVYIDGKRIAEARFPGGGVDLTAACRPGQKHTLSILVVALPLKGVMLSYTDSASARQVKGSVARRGLCGDVYVSALPASPRLEDVRIDTSVRKWEITFDSALAGLRGDGPYTLRATVMDEAKVARTFTSDPFNAGQIKAGRIAFTRSWKPEKLWDLHTPANVYIARVALLNDKGEVIDEAWPQRFGFREFWIDGRDFRLNGSRIFLSCVPFDNAQVGAAWASYAGARESLRRLKRIGINFVYTHNYGCEPGSHLSFAEILRAADDEGVLVALSQPHFSHYEWKAAGADAANGYATHARFYAQVGGNHPSVIAYAMSHNATGYAEDMNPDMIDGIQHGRDQWALNNVKLAQRAEAIVKSIDPGRIVYHHASGNLGPMHASNYYANFVPVQEQSDWFEHWATKGVKPLFTCEYAVPFTWDWTMYRGWYKGQREFGSAAVPWEFCLAEWNAQFLGDRAYRISEAEKANLRWEAKQFREGKVWHRWDYPVEVGSTRLEERYPVFAMYIQDNWRAFRTWGVSAVSPWEHGHYWKLRDGVDRGRKALPTEWDSLQRPWFSPDYLEQRYERVDLAHEYEDWIATPAAQALLRNNGPVLAYIAGKPAAFTSKDHLFTPGERIEKQLILINNSRENRRCQLDWSLKLPGTISRGRGEATIATGEQARLPVRVDLPKTVAPGRYVLAATFRFDTGPAQEDEFAIAVLPAPAPPRRGGRIALFDPAGETSRWLEGIGVEAKRIDAAADLAAFDVLIIGKSALTLDERAPRLARVREGLKVIVFEQAAEVLEKRLGFRVQEYGLRQVFPRIPDHPALAGMGEEQLRDWRGEATILPPRLKYEMRPRYGPTVQWCGIPVTRAWRCGNRGNVASVLIEKPPRGDFLPIVDGGFSLQYSPLMEYREGTGMVLFCQLDVTGRTESDPAAETIGRNLLTYVSQWKPAPRRAIVYVGEPAGRKHLEAAGFAVAPLGGELPTNGLLVIGSGAGPELVPRAAAIAAWHKSGGRILAIGLDERDLAALPVKVTAKPAEHIAAWFAPPVAASPFAGIAPADVHLREPRTLPLITGGLAPLGGGVIAGGDGITVCQIAPWQFAGSTQSNLRRTYRRSAFLLSRMLGNLQAECTTPLLSRFASPVPPSAPNRCLDGLYLDVPEEWDDPYRFFRW